MEFWDLYDEKRHPLDRTHPRGIVLKEGERHIVVNIWTINSEEQILLTLRDPYKEPWPNTWENTGGSVLAGESSTEGAVRELQEETGITINQCDLTLLTVKKGLDVFVDLYLVRKDVSIGNLALQEGETVAAKWVSPSELEIMSKEGLLAGPMTWQIKSLRSYLFEQNS